MIGRWRTISTRTACALTDMTCTDMHGYGDAQPVANNAIAKGRTQNWTVEILINR
jgi:flagellar motor protein MotB